MPCVPYGDFVPGVYDWTRLGDGEGVVTVLISVGPWDGTRPVTGPIHVTVINGTCHSAVMVIESPLGLATSLPVPFLWGAWLWAVEG